MTIYDNAEDEQNRSKVKGTTRTRRYHHVTDTPQEYTAALDQSGSLGGA